MSEHPFIKVYHELLSADTCGAVRAAFDADPRKYPGRTLGGYSAHAVKKRCTELLITGLPEWRALDSRVALAVSAASQRYIDDVPCVRRLQPISSGKMGDTGYQLQCYEPRNGATTMEAGGDGFDWHADATNKGSCVRYLALIVYLNTVDVGGETEFELSKIKVQPREGSILLFPPTFEYGHRGCPPVSGRKYILTSFFIH